MLWPGLKVLQSKADGESAFKRRRTAVAFAGKQATQLPTKKKWRPLHCPRSGRMVRRLKVKISITTLGFGFRGASGICQLAADATSDVHGSAVSTRPQWCGPDAFRSDAFIDDALQRELALSDRPEESTRS